MGILPVVLRLPTVMRLRMDMRRSLQRPLLLPLFTFSGRMWFRLSPSRRIIGTIAAIRKAIILTLKVAPRVGSR